MTTFFIVVSVIWTLCLLRIMHLVTIVARNQVVMAQMDARDVHLLRKGVRVSPQTRLMNGENIDPNEISKVR